MTPVISLKDLVFVAPAGWSEQSQTDHVLLQNMESGCLILILEPQPSSGNLEQDARAAFELMYQGWHYQKSDEQRLTLSKGRTPQGLEYCMMQAAMSTTTADGRYHLEDGAALVINAGAQVVIIGVRHNSSMFAHDQCSRYEGWPRFLASFTVKNAMLPATTDEDASKRIIGRWAMAEGRASGEYIFAANGHYQFTGALGTSYTTSGYDYEIIHTTTSAFEGDGSYSVSGNRLTLRRRADRKPEEVMVRFETVSRGGPGWNDRLYLLRKDATGDYEVAYEKQSA
jgi:hypothetical protein